MKVLMIKKNFIQVKDLNIQIFENDDNSNDEDDSENESENEQVVNEKSEDTGRTDDPVRMYLKEMGNVELLSRIGEIEIAKRIESVKNKKTDAFSKSFISMESIFNFYNDYCISDKQLRDFIDLDATFRSVNGEQDEFQDINIKDDEIFEDQDEEENSDKTRMMQILKMIAQKMLTKLQICQSLKKKKI